MLTGKDDIQNSIEILLSTGIGERVMRPDYGLSVESFIFETAAASLQMLLRDTVQKAILLHEPRVILNEVAVEAVVEEGLLRILIDYTISGTNTRHNVVFPFYLEEGSDIAQIDRPPASTISQNGPRS